MFGVDPHLKSATNEQLYRWQWRKVRVYEAARRMLVEAISSSKTAGARAVSLSPAVPVSPCPCVPVSLCLCVSVSLCPCVSVSLRLCVSVSL